MVDQTQGNGVNGPFVSGRGRGPEAGRSDGAGRGGGDSGRGMREGVSGVARHVLELSSLQSQLTATDLREAWGKASIPLACLGTAVTLGLASLPVVLFGAGLWLATAWDMSEATGLLLVAGGVVIAAAVCGGVALRKLRTAVSVLERSKSELIENVTSIRDTLARRDVD